MNIFTSLSEILFPGECTGCSKFGTWLCADCRKKFEPNIPECYVCRKISSGYTTHQQCKSKTHGIFENIIIAYQYNDIASKILKIYKYHSARMLASKFFELIDNRLHNELINSLQGSIILPVPLHYLRKSERGFNQAELITRIISKEYKISYDCSFIIRKRNTPHQAGTGRQSRLVNVRNAFYISKKAYNTIRRLKKITLFDDVLTTGATIEEAGRAILSINPDISLSAFALFRGRKRQLRNKLINM